MKKITFEDALKRFTTSQKASMKYAKLCADMALQQFKDHGDLSKCQAFHDAMERNYSRRPAYVKWLVDFAPVKIEGGKLLKDKERGDDAFDLEAAFKTPFWEHDPQQQIVNYSADDVVQHLRRVIKRFESHKNYRPEDTAATVRLSQATKMVEELSELPIPEASNDEETPWEEDPEETPAAVAA